MDRDTEDANYTIRWGDESDGSGSSSSRVDRVESDKDVTSGNWHTVVKSFTYFTDNSSSTGSIVNQNL